MHIRNKQIICAALICKLLAEIVHVIGAIYKARVKAYVHACAL